MPIDRTLDPDTLEPEGRFRYAVRDILNLDPFTRDLAIFAELRRLKRNNLIRTEQVEQFKIEEVEAERERARNR